MKTISQASKIGWLESKVIQLFGSLFGESEKQHKEESPLGALVSAARVTHTFPSKTECYIGSTGIKQLRVVQYEMAYGGNGEPLPFAVNSLADDPEYVQCGYCGIYLSPVNYYKHIGNVRNKEIITSSDRIPSIPACKKYPIKTVSLGRAVWCNGRYRELFRDERVIDMAMVERIPTVKPEDAEDLLTDPENLEDERKGQVCAEVLYPYQEALERQQRAQVVSEPIDAVGETMIRFVRDSYNGEPNKIFSVELNGKLRPFTVQEDYKSDFHPMFRFATGTSEHRLCHNGVFIALIEVTYDPFTSSTVTKVSNKDGELREFFLPSSHDFFKYVIVEVTAKEVL